MSDRFVITVRQGVASDLHGARLRLERRPELLREGPRRRAVGDPRQDRRRLRAGGRGAGARHRGGRADRLQRRRRGDRADLLPAPRGDRLLPRRASAARRRSTRSSAAPTPCRPELAQFFRDVNDHLKLVNEEVVAQRDLLAIDPAGEHGRHLRRAERDQRAPERDRQAADADRHDLPAADVHHRLLRAELRLARSTSIDTLGAFLVFGVGSFVGAGIVLLLWFRTGHPAGTERPARVAALRALIPTDAATPPPSRPDPPASAGAPAARRAPTRT